MNIKAAAGLIVATSMFAVAGPLQAGCMHHQPGWHMVSKRCNIKNADTWQEYNSGVYLQPVVGKSMFPTMKK